MRKLDREYLVNRSEFAKIAGVSRAAITKALKFNRKLKQATNSDGNIDISHPCATEYLEIKREKNILDIVDEYERGVAGVFKEKRLSQKKAPKRIIVEVEKNEAEEFDVDVADDVFSHLKYKSDNGSSDLVEIPSNVEAFLDYTLLQIYQKFGNVSKFIDFLKSCQIIAGINEKNLKNAILEGKLVSRESVEKNFFDVVNSAHLKLMTDGAKNIAGTIKSKILSGASDVEVEEKIIDIIGTFIRPIKPKMKKAIEEYKKMSTIIDDL